MPRTEHQQVQYHSQSQERKNFIDKQIKLYDWTEMEWNMFMPFDWKCYHCNADVIQNEIDKWNDWSKWVTWCSICHRTYCD